MEWIEVQPRSFVREAKVVQSIGALAVPFGLMAKQKAAQDGSSPSPVSRTTR